MDMHNIYRATHELNIVLAVLHGMYS